MIILYAFGTSVGNLLMVFHVFIIVLLTVTFSINFLLV